MTIQRHPSYSVWLDRLQWIQHRQVSEARTVWAGFGYDDELITAIPAGSREGPATDDWYIMVAGESGIDSCAEVPADGYPVTAWCVPMPISAHSGFATFPHHIDIASARAGTPPAVVPCGDVVYEWLFDDVYTTTAGTFPWANPAFSGGLDGSGNLWASALNTGGLGLVPSNPLPPFMPSTDYTFAFALIGDGPVALRVRWYGDDDYSGLLAAPIDLGSGAGTYSETITAPAAASVYGALSVHRIGDDTANNNLGISYLLITEAA